MLQIGKTALGRGLALDPYAFPTIGKLSVAAIDTGLWLRDSTVAWYVGSSGALHGVMAAGTLAHLRRGHHP